MKQNPLIDKVVEHLYDCILASSPENGWIFVRKDIVGDAISLLKKQQKLIDDITQRRANNGAFD